MSCDNSFKGSFDKETLEKYEWTDVTMNVFEEIQTITLNFNDNTYTWHQTYVAKSGETGVKFHDEDTYVISGNSIRLNRGATLTFDRDSNGRVILKCDSYVLPFELHPSAK